MTAKFLLVNNGLKDLVGHYYESSISVAEAARASGYEPALATNVSCPTDILPEWIQAYPLFRGDHFGVDAAQRLPNIQGLRADPYTQVRLNIEDVRGGQATVEEYIRAYVELPGSETTPQVSLTDGSLQHPGEQTITREAARALSEVGCLDDLELALIFKQDLERFLSLVGITPADHVFLPTAHGRDLLSAALVVHRFGEEFVPTFHLEFRHSLFLADPIAHPAQDRPYLAQHRAYFAAYARAGRTAHIHLYTDTEELAQEYREISGFHFNVLPIPFRSNSIVAVSKPPGRPLCFAYVGEARDEKGFHWLPDAIDALMPDYILPGKICFRLQTTLRQPAIHQPLNASCLPRLLNYDPKHVNLVGLGSPLSMVEYYRTLSDADVVICPHHAYRYRNSSSGTLIEAIVAGKPSIVPSHGWMARQQPPGTGECFQDQRTFVEAIKRLCDNHEQYWRCARAYRRVYRFHHAPETLIRRLAGCGGRSSALGQSQNRLPSEHLAKGEPCASFIITRGAVSIPARAGPTRLQSVSSSTSGREATRSNASLAGHLKARVF